jgi:hypothetical protein
MTVTTIAPPAEILASEPTRRRGTKSHFEREGDRRYRFSWKVGEKPHFDEPWAITAALTISHHKASESRSGAHYRATLRRDEDGPNGIVRSTFNGTNGDAVLAQFEGAGRFNEQKFLAFAEAALVSLRSQAQAGEVRSARLLAYFDPNQEV